MKRSPMSPRQTPLRSTGRRIARSPMKHKARPAAETRRIYGTPEHRAWMKRQPCWFCGARPSDAAHIRNGGIGRKADWTQTFPLCSDTIEGRGHHSAFDADKKGWRARYDLDAICAEYVARFEAWLARVA